MYADKVHNPKKICPICGGICGIKTQSCSRCFNLNRAKKQRKESKGTYHKKGYHMVLRPPEHPRKGYYIFEHILVMESIIGRYLLPEETVHHKNGIRNDNSPDNLELWTKPPFPGIRAKDAYDFAIKIIEIYSPLYGEGRS